jgi:hypothetical protein
MSKKNKKRNKTYTGIDATASKPTVHHYVAVRKSPLREWWEAKRRLIKIVAIIVGVIALLAYVLSQLFRPLA